MSNVKTETHHNAPVANDPDYSKMDIDETFSNAKSKIIENGCNAQTLSDLIDGFQQYTIDQDKNKMIERITLLLSETKNKSYDENSHNILGNISKRAHGDQSEEIVNLSSISGINNSYMSITRVQKGENGIYYKKNDNLCDIHKEGYCFIPDSKKCTDLSISIPKLTGLHDYKRWFNQIESLLEVVDAKDLLKQALIYKANPYSTLIPKVCDNSEAITSSLLLNTISNEISRYVRNYMRKEEVSDSVNIIYAILEYLDILADTNQIHYGVMSLAFDEYRPIDLTNAIKKFMYSIKISEVNYNEEVGCRIIFENNPIPYTIFSEWKRLDNKERNFEGLIRIFKEEMKSISTKRMNRNINKISKNTKTTRGQL